jgi:chromate transport protein ChrA
MVISLGYFTGGLSGAMLTLIAINLPPLLVLVVEKLYRRVKITLRWKGLFVD